MRQGLPRRVQQRLFVAAEEFAHRRIDPQQMPLRAGQIHRHRCMVHDQLQALVPERVELIRHHSPLLRYAHTTPYGLPEMGLHICGVGT